MEYSGRFRQSRFLGYDAITAFIVSVNLARPRRGPEANWPELAEIWPLKARRPARSTASSQSRELVGVPKAAEAAMVADRAQARAQALAQILVAVLAPVLVPVLMLAIYR